MLIIKVLIDYESL